MDLRTWYFCVNERGFAATLGLTRAAVASARANTDLRPVCLYNGEDAGHVAALEALGVEVVRHRSTFEDDLRAGYGDRFDTFSGHWLRVDIPLIERTDDVVLYTDVDVMFLRAPALPGAPRFLAAAPEIRKHHVLHFNSGVMVMNLVALRAVHDRFVAAIRARLRGEFRYPAHDQASYNRFFRWRYRRMSPLMNWKPFWGLEPGGRIVHFHGPKPEHARLFAQGKGAGLPAIYRRLYDRAPQAYGAYASAHAGFAARAPGPPPRA